MKSIRYKLFVIIFVCTLVLINGNCIVFAATPADENFDSYTNTTGSSNIYSAGLLNFETTGDLAYVGVVGSGDFNGISLPGFFSSKVLSNDYLVNGTATSFSFSSVSTSNNFKLNSFVACTYTGGTAIPVDITGYNNGTQVVKVTGIDLVAEADYYDSNAADAVTVGNLVNDTGNGIYAAKLTFGSNWTEIDKVVITPNGSPNLLIALDTMDFSNVVDLSVSDAAAVTEGGTAKFTISLSKAYSSPVTVNYTTADNTAKAADGDYASTSNIATIPAGSTSVDINVPISDNTDYEDSESFYLNILNPSVGGITDSQGECTINDNDNPPTVSLSTDKTSVVENGGLATLTATLSNKSYQPVTVNLSYSGAATSGTDYTKSDSIVIPAGSLSGTLAITGVNDTTYEGDETVNADISGVTNGTAGSTKQVTATITDDDSEPTVTLGITPSTFSENAETATVTATLSNTSYQDVTVTLAFSGTAVSGDYTVSGTNYTASSKTLVIPAESQSNSITLTSIDNSSYTGDKTVILDISDVTNGAEDGTQQKTATITEDDSAPSVTLSIADSPLAENGGVAKVTATLSGTSIEEITVNLDYTGTALVGTDYTASDNKIVILAGSLSGTATITGADDMDYEAVETVIADITSVTGGVENGTQQQIVTITDNDSAPSVELSLPVSSFSEADGTVTITAELSNKSYQPVTVNLSYSGTATSGTDYTKSDSIVIPAGSQSGTVTITGVNDTAYEGNETVIADISGIINGTVGSIYQVTATITDNDSQPTVSLSVSPLTFPENAGVATVTATLSNKSYQPVTVDLGFTGTAFSGVYYTESDTTITIPAGSLTGTIALTAIGNTAYTGDKTVVVDISNVTNGAENGTQQVIATITDDDPAPSVTLTKSVASLAENGGLVTLTATLTGTSIEDITVNLGYTGTAVEGTDYTASDNKIIILAGSLSGTATITIANDTDYEAAETVIVDITGVTGAVENGEQQQTVTITNDDAAPTVTLSTNKTSIDENGETATVTATLSNTSYKDVTVELGFTGTAAGGGTDYTTSDNKIVIPAGNLSGTIIITGVNNDTYKGNKTVTVDISSVANGTENGTQQVEIYITDDEAAPSVTLSVTGSPFTENGGTATVTATLSNTSYLDVTVELGYSGTAVNGTDYTTSGSSIVISAGSLSKSITLTGIDNAVYAGDKTLIVDISSVTNGTENGTQQVTTSITDDDPVPAINFAAVTITAPVVGVAPQTTAQVETATANSEYTVTNVIWNEALTAGGKFKAGQVYTATIELTSKSTKEFQAGAFTPTVAGSASVGTTTTAGTGAGNKVSFTVTYAATGAVEVNNIEVKTQPADLIYVEGETLNLSGIEAKLTYSDTSTEAVVFTDFSAKGITASPVNGTALTVATHNNTSVTISCNGHNANTNNLTVTAADPVITSGAAIISVTVPESKEYKVGEKLRFTVNFDKNVIVTNTDLTLNINIGETIKSAMFESTTSASITFVYTVQPGDADANGIVVGAITLNNSKVTDISGNNAVLVLKNIGNTNGILINTNNPPPNPGNNTSGSGSSSNTTIVPDTKDNKVDIIFGDNTYKAATAKVEEKGGVKTTTVTLDDAAIKENLDKMNKANPTGEKKVILPVYNKSDVVIGVLNGQTVKNMEDNNAILEIKTENVTYTLPAADINIEDVSNKLGKQVKLEDIKVSVKISASSKETISTVQNTADKNSYQLVVKPVEFEITCTNGTKTVSVSKFNSYVERTVAIPDGIDPKKITTGVVLNSDGTFSHVPTAIIVIDGKYYAKINSLTNSTYTVIWNPITFKDAEKHWSKSYVNDIGSRLIDSGVGNGNFAPDKAITRAEFASMIVKALGLKGTNFTDKFNDVKKSDSYYSCIYTAYEYGILQGYTNGKFGPQDLITREQAMTMLSKAMEIAGMDVNVSEADISSQLKLFKDSGEIASYAKQSASICIKYGIFDGSKGKLTPKDSFTRAESATVVIKLLKKAGLI